CKTQMRKLLPERGRQLAAASGGQRHRIIDLLRINMIRTKGLTKLHQHILTPRSAHFKVIQSQVEIFESGAKGPRFAKLKNWHNGLSAQILNIAH
ncbi:LIM domain-binding protein 3a, partial [Tachysurus ichikawai]